MLDLSVILAQMTQGQAPAEMTPLGTAPAAAGSAAPGGESTAGAASAPAPGAATGAPAVDPHVIADRVYELMRRDLLVHVERLGGR